MVSRLLRFFEYAALRAVSFVVALLPLPALRAVARSVGALLMNVVRVRRTVADQNLRRAFPSMTERARSAITRSSYNNLSTTFLELLTTRTMTQEELLAQWEIEGLELIERSDKGAVFISAHFSNWEWFAMATALAGKKNIFIVTKEQRNSKIDHFIDSLRMRFGNGLIGMDNIRGMIAILRSGGFVAMLGDQAASEQSVEATFFGEPLPTFRGAATLSLKLHVPLIFGVAHRKANGSYVARLREVSRSGCETYTDENVAKLTQRHVAMLEEEIRSSPGQWLWLHRRWKHRELTS